MNRRPSPALQHFWPMRQYLVTSGGIDHPNVAAISFCMPVAKSPAMFACAIGRAMYTSQLIRQTGELVVNMPTRAMTKFIRYCGSHTGKTVDKFNATSLSPIPLPPLKTPAIAQCPVVIGGRVYRTVDCGDKVLFIAKVVVAEADTDEVANTDWSIGQYPEHVYGNDPTDPTSAD